MIIIILIKVECIINLAVRNNVFIVIIPMMLLLLLQQTESLGGGRIIITSYGRDLPRRNIWIANWLRRGCCIHVRWPFSIAVGRGRGVYSYTALSSSPMIHLVFDAYITRIVRFNAVFVLNRLYQLPVVSQILFFDLDFYTHCKNVSKSGTSDLRKLKFRILYIGKS